MRKTVVLWLIFNIIALGLFYISPKFIAHAEEKPVEEQLEDEVEEKLDDLNLNDFQAYLDGLTAEQKSMVSRGDLKEVLSGIASGELDASAFTDCVNTSLKGALGVFSSYLGIFVTIMVISILGSILSGLSSGFLKKETTEIIGYVCYAAVVITLLASLVPLIDGVRGTIAMIKELSLVLFPIMLTLMTALGGVVSVGIYRPMLAIFATGIIGVVDGVILPFFIAALVMTVVGNIASNIKLGKLTEFFKSSAGWLLGVMFSLFLSLVTMQGLTGSTVDKLSVSAAKFAISSYVPVLGGYLSDGFDLVLASCVIVKNAVGFTGVLLLLGVILMPIIKIVVFMLGLKLTAALAEPLGDERISSMLYSVSKCLNLLIAALAGVGFLMFLLIMLVMYSCNLGV